MKNTVAQDAITRDISSLFDYDFDGTTTFEPPEFSPPKDFSIGLIVGPSGSGKSTLLGQLENVTWSDGISVASHFTDAKEAAQRLSGVGLNSIPSWLREYEVLSTGEKFRADLARRIKTGARIDEFTSVVDRAVACSCSTAVARFIKANSIKNVIFASCHYDIIPWLQPDWVFDTATGGFDFEPKKGQTSHWRSFLVGSRLGQCSATITISQQTSIRVHAAGLPRGEI